MDRPLDSKPILGYVVLYSFSKAMGSNKIYSTPGTAIAAVGVSNYRLISDGFADKYSTAKEFKMARKAAFAAKFILCPVYAGDSI